MKLDSKSGLVGSAAVASMFTGLDNALRPWQRESRVMLNEAMRRLDRQIARLEREAKSRGARRPDQLRKIVQLHTDALTRRALVWDEIQRREKLAQARS